MNKVASAFTQGKAFIAYLMAGDPNLQASAQYILTAQEAGADLIEVGIPFSDPIAEGPVIQAAGLRALATGTRLTDVFDMVSSIKDKLHVPLVFMTYLNPVFVYGYQRFFAKCAQLGVAGVIIPDLPFEEQDEAVGHAAQHGIQLITLIAPTTNERIARIARSAQGFIYLVSSMGVTGVREEITTDLRSMVAEIRSVTDTPVAIGFGIATTQQAAHFAGLADGVIVGSAVVDIIAKHGAQASEPLYDYIRQMKLAVSAD